MYKKVTITYHAAKNDSKVDEVAGLTFYDGKAEVVTISASLYEELKNNRFFEMSKPVDVTDQEALAEKQKETEKAERVAESHKR
jgi:hypothetical protein